MKDTGIKMVLVIIFFILYMPIPAYTAAPPVQKICLEGIEYYKIIEKSGGSFFKNPRGYGFIAPVINSETLTFVRCKKEIRN